MRLVSFHARKVYGYIDVEIRFNELLTFLIGPNGSGKSTALQLMEALLTPSLKQLALTSFEDAELVIDDGGREQSIKALKRNGELVMLASWVESILVIKDLGAEQISLLSEDNRMSEDYFRSLSVQLSSNEVFKAISGVYAPVFLGIERRHRSPRSEDMGAHDGVHFVEGSSRNGVRVRRILRGNLAAGLTETQVLVQEAYRNARRQLDVFQESLRNDVLLSAFHYADTVRDSEGKPSFEFMSNDINLDVSSTRADIETALEGIGLSKKKIDSRIGPFFSKLSQLLARSSAPENVDAEVFFEFLMNKGQLDRLQGLIALVQEYKKKNDGVFKKINSFVETVNWFFRDSAKTISLDAVGRIEVARSDGLRIPLDALSSGERQLIIIFAHLFFNVYGSRSKIFVIDEPELSLHLRWQENLVSKAQESMAGIQLVMATHSPDIVGAYKDMCVAVG